HEYSLRRAIPANKEIGADGLNWVVAANRESDAHQFDSYRHFDNAWDPKEICTLWNQGLDAYLERAVKWAAPVGVEKRELDAPETALNEFGRATHALQDFYSHTNWVELHDS